MRTSVIFAALALALTVNADITQQVIADPTQEIMTDIPESQLEESVDEKISSEDQVDPIEGCINGLSILDPQFDELTNIVYSFNSTDFNQGLDDAVSIAVNISTIIKNLETTTADCCRMPVPLSEDESNLINEKLDVLTPQIKRNMKAFTYEKRAFQSVYFATAIVKGHLEVLHTNTSAALNCIMASTSLETSKATKRYIKQIEYAFEDTRSFLDM